MPSAVCENYTLGVSIQFHVRASEELPINLTSADGDVNRGEDAVNEQHVASLAAPIDSSHGSANATSSEPNPTASFTKDNLIPVEVSTYLELILI